MQQPNPLPEHEWLLALVGEWSFDSECQMGPDQPPMKSAGTQTTRSLGSLWILGEMLVDDADGEPMRSVMTLGFDPIQSRFVGTFVSSCMTYLWPYDGQLDSARKVLTLDSEGPSFAGDGTMAKFQDIIEVLDRDHYVLASRYRDANGSWTNFMRANYTRKS